MKTSAYGPECIDESLDSLKNDGAGSSEASVPSTYQYDSLESGQFRLLALLEADGRTDDLECSLLTSALADYGSSETPDGEPYTALSYVSGRGEKTKIVYIDDKHLYIGRNLDSALRHLRRRDRPTLIWVDALCINQDDLHERNHQVQQMRDIFERADETVAYLGNYKEGNVTDSAWNFLERQSSWALNEAMEKDYDIPRQREDEIHFRGDLDDVFRTVFTREWFLRVWVFQEAVVSKRLSIQSGYRRVPWDDFIRSSVLQMRNHDRYGQSLTQMNRFEFARQLWQARVSYHAARGQQQYLPPWHSQYAASGQETPSTDMLDMLVLARSRQATDPRDKVFALLGVSTGFDWQTYETINYEKPTAEIYQDFAFDYMTSHKDYRMLSYLNRVTRPEFLQRQMHRWSTLRKRPPFEPGTVPDMMEEDDNERSMYSESLIQQSLLDSSINEPQEEAQFLPSWFLGSVSQSGSQRLRGSQGELNTYAAMATLSLSTWVPDWNCRDLSAYEPRAIIEVIDPARDPTSATDQEHESSPSGVDVECFRTWIKGYAIGSQALRTKTLAVQGRVIGRLVSAMSSTSLLGRDEATFTRLRANWEHSQGQQSYSLEVQQLAVWTYALEQTKLEEQLNGEDVGQLNPQHARKLTCKVDDALVVWAKRNVSFPFSWETMPPEPTTIESLLVERAGMGTDWVQSSVGSVRVVPAPKSAVHQRLIVLFRGTELDFGNPHPKTVLLREERKKRNGEDLGEEKLVLLPLEAKFGDLVVMFPGAKVPFLVRKKHVSRMDEIAARKVHRGNLPRIETAKKYVECALIGECWVNGFKEMVMEDKVNDVLFSVQ